MNGTVVAVLVVSSANLLLTGAMAYAMFQGKKEIEAEIDNVKTKTNKTLFKLKSALEDLEL